MSLPSIFYAARDGDTDSLVEILRSGTDADTRDDGRRTPLMFAAGNARLAAVRLLIEHGADRYHVFYGTDMTKMSLYGSATQSELEVRGLTEGTKYFFYVKAINAQGESAPSNFTSRRTL